MDKKYIPISCDEYDKLEILAMHRTPIILIPHPYETTEPLIIIDLRSTDSVEHMYLSNGERIRLDYIATIIDHMIFLDWELYMSEEE